MFTDTYVYEVWPPQDWAAMMVVHMIHLRDMGQLQGQNFDLEALAAECAADGRYEFLFTALARAVHRRLQRPGAPRRHPLVTPLVPSAARAARRSGQLLARCSKVRRAPPTASICR